MRVILIYKKGTSALYKEMKTSTKEKEELVASAFNKNHSTTKRSSDYKFK